MVRSVSRVVTALILLAVGGSGGCLQSGLAPSIWPPEDFRLTVEELHFEGSLAHVTRRLVVDHDGLVVYGTSARPLVDPTTGTSLPVFDRLAIYELVPICVRALARRIDRLGVMAIDSQPGEADAVADGGVVVVWQAFGSRRVLPVRGRVRGPLAEIMAVVGAHLPPGETFDVELNRPIVPVLRGVPEPRADASGALAALDDLAQQRASDAELLLDGFALACSLGRRDEAERLLAKWTELTAPERTGSGAFRDGPRLGPELLGQFLPPR